MCPAVANKSAIKQSSYLCIECAESSAYRYDHQQNSNLVLIAQKVTFGSLIKLIARFLASAKYFQTKGFSRFGLLPIPSDFHCPNLAFLKAGS
jgi:ribose 5-phosphate isomerase RpiB